MGQKQKLVRDSQIKINLSESLIHIADLDSGLEGHSQLFEGAEGDDGDVDGNGSDVRRQLNWRFLFPVSVGVDVDSVALVLVGRVGAVGHLVATLFDWNARAVVTTVFVLDTLINKKTVSNQFHDSGISTFN